MSATITAIDARRTDQRKQSGLYNPYWITSAELGGIMYGTSQTVPIDTYHGNAAVLFDFPYAGRVTQVHQVVVQITQLFAASGGAATLTVGWGTIPLATSIAPGINGTLTFTSTDNAYVLAADVTMGTVGYYTPTSNHTSAWLTSAYGGTVSAAASQFILGVDGDTGPVFCVALFLIDATGSSVITSGRVRVHMLISEFPGEPIANRQS